MMGIEHKDTIVLNALHYNMDSKELLLLSLLLLLLLLLLSNGIYTISIGRLKERNN